jgi:hypothetical protein
MPSAEITFTEFGPAAPTASAARVVAKVGICSGGSTSNVCAFDVPSQVAEALGEGPLVEATAQAVRVSKQRTLALPIEASTPGVLGTVVQTGSGPALLVVGEPRDTATVRVQIVKTGPLGVGRFRVSISSTAAGGQIVPRYRSELALPVRRQAEITGTKNLGALAYATPASITGSADLRVAALFGLGGSLDGQEVSAKIDGAPSATCKLAAPADAAAALAQLATVFGGSVLALSPSGRLVWTTKAVGKAASIEITGGSALPLLGLSPALTTGKPGDLDERTLDLRLDGKAPQTVTFKPPPASPAAVAARLVDATGLEANLVPPANKLRIASATVGDGSRLAILGGDACDLLGLPVAGAQGAEATTAIPGLGLTVQFPPGVYVKDTVYECSTVAPSFSIEAVLGAVDKLVRVGASFRILHVVGELADAAETRALAEALDTKIAELEGLKRPIVAIIGAPLAESDAALVEAFAGFVSRRVCVCARGAWLRGGTLGGSFLRSQSWAAAYKAAAFRFSSDLGNHDDGALPEVDALPVDEVLAVVKLRAARFTVMDTSGGRIYFARGLTMAAESSRYRDLNVTRLMIEAYLVAQPILDREINNDPPVNDDETLETTTAGAIDRALEKALGLALVPDHATRVRARVSRTEKVWSTNRLPATITVVPRGQIYEVSALLGPGLITEEAEE